MIPYVVLAVLLGVLCVNLENSYIAIAQKSEIQDSTDKFTNQKEPDDKLGNNTDLLAELYTPAQISEMIYRLHDDIHINNTEARHFEAIAVLLDLICYDEYYENIIQACDSVTGIQIE